MALGEAYKNDVHFPHSPLMSDPTNRERWYRNFREASASLGCLYRNDDSILYCWRKLKREHKEEDERRKSTGVQLLLTMDVLLGTLPTVTAPYVYSSFSRTFTDNCQGDSTSQARRPSVSADDQSDVNRRKVSNPPTTNAAPNLYKITNTNINGHSLPPLIAIGYVLMEQNCSLFGLQYKDDPTVILLYEIVKEALDHQIQNHKAAVDVHIVGRCYRNSKAIQNNTSSSKRGTNETLKKSKV